MRPANQARAAVSAGALLFAATAAVVIWQNWRLGVLWDLSCVLETAQRMALGQVPYRDFPLAFPPLTFLVQAWLIKLTGRVFFHHIVYCATVGGLATLLSWRILRKVLRSSAEEHVPEAAAFLLALPLAVLGVYSIFPHPFYDCDCTFAILGCVLLMLRVEEKAFPPALTFLSGMALVIPPLVKQNTGLAFLASSAAAFFVLILSDRRNRRGYVILLSGAAAGVAVAAAAIQFTAGLANYRHWTFAYAAARRLPGWGDMLAIYHNRLLLWWLPAIAAGALLLARTRRRTSIAGAALISLPFAWTVACLLTDADPSDKVECLLALWPLLLIVALVAALLAVRRRHGVALILPFVVIATVHGALMSQQIWGSTYALWPLLMLLIASSLAAFGFPQRRGLSLVSPVIAVALLISGTYYIWSHERLNYAQVGDGSVERSRLPALRGLHVRGPWLPQFDELVAYADANIPRQDAILMLPGEDLFYYATGRTPRFPVPQFDHTMNPYSPEAIIQMARERDVRWLVLKRDLQLDADPMEDKDKLLDLLLREFTKVEELDNYDVYRRKAVGISPQQPDGFEMGSSK